MVQSRSLKLTNHISQTLVDMIKGLMVSKNLYTQYAGSDSSSGKGIQADLKLFCRWWILYCLYNLYYSTK